MAAEPERGEIHLPRLARPGLLAVFILLAAGLSVIAFAAGSRLRSPAEVSVPLVTSVGPTYASVAHRRVGEAASADGTFSGGHTIDIRVALPPGAQRLVVDQVNVRPGRVVHDGEVVAVVSGRPVIAVVMPVPLSRSLMLGEVGPDVRKVQVVMQRLGLLDGVVDDQFGPRLRSAVAAFYAARGFDPPAPQGEQGGPPGTGATTVQQQGQSAGRPGEFVAIDELLALPQPGAIVVSVASPGTVLEGATGSLGRLRVGDAVVKARVDVDSAAQFPRGAPVRIQIPGVDAKAFKGQVSAISSFRESKSPDELPGYDVTISLTGTGEALQDGQSVRVSPAAVAVAESLAVPLVALRQDGRGTYVLVDRGTPGRPGRAGVVVLRQADGWAAIADGGDVGAGDRVQVTP